jgi:hypothetical protein
MKKMVEEYFINGNFTYRDLIIMVFVFLLLGGMLYTQFQSLNERNSERNNKGNHG